jgi:tetratricopeptide (TPR) repeat protein
MTHACDQLDAFFDGELRPVDADAFQLHLGACRGCAEALHDRVMLQALRDDLAEASVPLPKASAAPSRRWLRAVPLVSTLALAACVAFVATWKTVKDPAPVSLPELAFLEEATRPVEVRLSYPPADAYRPYGVARGADQAHGHVPLELLAKLEKAHEYRGVAAGMLLSAEPARAHDYLTRAPASLDAEVDLAAVAIVQGQYEEALDRLDGALEKNPNHPQALWNQALAMRELHLPLAAAESFEKVASLHEPGWSDEAKRRADALKAEGADRAAQWTAARAALDAMVEDGAVPADAVVRAYPSYARFSLYDAVRTTASRDRILSFLPLAIRLEGGDEHAPLVRYVRSLADGDLARRARFVARVAALNATPLPPDGLAALVAELGAAGEDDLAFEAVALAHAWARFAAPIHRVATAHDDPWLRILDARASAYAAADQGEFTRAESTLRAALASCDASHFDYLCAGTRLQLADMLIQNLHALEAAVVVGDGLRQSEVQAPGVWRALAGDAAELAELRGAYPLMRAYFRDLLLHQPTCATRRHAHEAMAKERLLAMDRDGVARELAADETCEEPMTLDRAVVTTVLARMGDPRIDVRRARTDLAAARADFSPGERSFADVLLGVLSLREDPSAGKALVQRGLDATRARREDGTAQAALAWGDLNLALSAAREGDAAGALARMATDVGGAGDEACSLAVGLDYELAFAAARDAAGATLATFDDRIETAMPSPDQLVPGAIRAHLAGCPSVRVFAPPPVHGNPELLPADVAWSFHASGRRALPKSDAATLRRLLVSDVEPPAALGLARLDPWSAPPGSDATVTWLHGADATPRRVLDELATASEAEIDAHGLTDPGVSDAPLLALSPEPDGRYALTAAAIEARHFENHPVVVLAACRGGRVAPYFHETWSLPSALLRAGARVVLAASAPIPDAEARRFFDAVLQKIRAGAEPSVALRDVRVAWLRESGHEWVRTVLVFD